MKKNNLLRTGWVPQQHGAWAMTFVPILVGIAAGGPATIQALLLISWTFAFLFFNAFGLWVKAVRKSRYLAATVSYGALAAIGATALLIWRSDLWVWGIPLAACFLLATVEILRRNERSLLARISAILASSLMAPIAFSIGSNPTNWQGIWVSTAILTLYFIGTVPYVKTLIRERGSQTWLIGSLAFHLAVLIGAAGAAILGHVHWPVPAIWLILLFRAWVYPEWSQHRNKPLSPKVIGISEFVFCGAVVASVLLS